MRYIIFLWIFLLFNCSESSTGSNKNDLQTSGKVDPFEQNTLLQRSINLGNALEAPGLGEWGVVLKEEYFKIISDAGFSAVRIPCRWSAYTTSSAPFKIRSDFMNLVKWSLDQCQKYDLAVVINVHHFEEIFSTPAQQKEKFLAIWKQIATEFKNRPTSVFYEILNEPHDNLTAELWNEYLQDAIEVVRAIDTTHTLIIGTAEWGGISAMQKLEIPETEDNVIFTFHYYNPFQFTHQGAEWVDGADEWLGTQWVGSTSEINAVRSEFNNVKAWAEQRNLPVYVGEFGAYNKADINSRARWTNFIVSEAEADGFSWAYWEFIAGFGAYNGTENNWNEPLLNALIPD
ncbi:MAG: glycoside hydrolase family 5 protein [Calditrichaeota bacterium]|nr:glycoside hydrolase family 5 protein [Calditrichota bacterium]